ncbi:TetR/AcrR family transcriptional regulator [Endozoicomonas gorgoniicola]|uniref:TetR/AcrR family transcriptional regulator n=1 Tax=Endozoicomonas gorgoniicola TaxID=1234144 RepID=A0ABT3MRP2_9GAMM|nr:TetR/AcrR family transcriptional regulator [Endozoicomonas gorgoniicola]MCW7552041.1 TetR/AcrR family transcriptional regulator [Endozoicomonas gorgoniicola]
MDLEQVTNRRTPSQYRSRTRVTIILDTVKTLIEEKGIEQLKVNDIAERANTSMGSIYQYFSNKDSMVLALAEYFAETIRGIIDHNMRELNSFNDLRRFMLKNFDDIYRLHKNEPALRQIWFDSINPELNRLAIIDSQINADKIYHRLVEQFEPADKALLRRFILLICYQFGNMMRLCFENDDSTPEQFRDLFIDIMATSAPNYLREIKAQGK